MNRPEQNLQRVVASYIEAAYPALIYWHTPNGGGRNIVEAKILKAMGVKAGVADLTFILPTGLAAFIELKAGNGRLTPPQEAFRDRVTAIGCLYAEARSLEDVQGTLDAWLRPLGHHPRARIAA